MYRAHGKATRRPKIATLVVVLLTLGLGTVAWAGPKRLDTSDIHVRRTRYNVWVVERDQVSQLTTARGRRALLDEITLGRARSHGKQRGYRLKSVKGGSLAQRLGLRGGDVLVAVNGVALTSDGQAWRAYNASKDASTIRVVIQRGSRCFTHYYRIR